VAGADGMGVGGAVHLRQAEGVFSRFCARCLAVNHDLGNAILGLAIRATLALAAFLRARAGFL